MPDADTTHAADDAATDTFIARWQGVAASELSTSQSFLIDLCRLLGVDTPHPTPEQDYTISLMNQEDEMSQAKGVYQLSEELAHDPEQVADA